MAREQLLHKTRYQIENKNFKSAQITLNIRGMQIKTTMRSHYIPTRMDSYLVELVLFTLQTFLNVCVIVHNKLLCFKDTHQYVLVHQ